MKLTRRMSISHGKINPIKQYDINDALVLLKALSTVKFIESVDVAINLNIDARNSEQNIRGTTVLPHGTGCNVRVAVFAQDSYVKIAKLAGADMIGMYDLAEKIKKDKKINFDVVIASPEAMQIVSQLGQILGPRGLMPNPKVGTVTSNIEDAIKNVKTGQIFFRNDKNGIIHTIIGKINFEPNQLKENLENLLITLEKVKPKQCKGVYIKKISLSTTMSNSIIINQYSLFTTIQ